MKILVYGSLFIAVLQSGLEGYFTYGYLGGEWGNPFVNEDSPLTFQLLQDLQPALDSLTALFVQFFFTWRIWTFCTAVCGRQVRLLVAAICLLLVMASTCGFLAIAILPFTLIPGVDMAKFDLRKIILIWTVPSAVVDVTITVSMMIILTHARSRSHARETRYKISQLLRITIQTGFLTTILAIPIAPLYILSLNTAAYAFTTFPLGKCYLISLLANLNARARHPTVHLAVATGTDSDNVTGTQLSYDHNNQDPVRTAHRDPTRAVSPNEPVSRMDREARPATRDGGIPEVVHARRERKVKYSI